QTADVRICNRAIGVELPLIEVDRNHQMGGALPHVADLEGRIPGNLPLNGQVPLVGYSRLNVGPGQHSRVDERIACWRCRCRERALDVKCGRACCCIGPCRLRRCKGWILRRAQVGSSAFLERRNREARADNSLASQKRRTPGEAESRLEVQPSVRGRIQPSRESIGAHNSRGYRRASRKLQRTREDIHIHLTIMQLRPGGSVFVAQTQVQGEVVGYTPVVLNETGDEPVARVPATATYATPDAFREPEGEVSRWVPCTSVARIVSSYAQAEDFSSEFPSVARIKHIQVIFL